MPDYVIACDFDGTITCTDTLHLLVETFGDGSIWRDLHPRIMDGSMSVEDAMQTEMSSVRVDRETAVAYVRDHAGLRAGFAEFVAFLQERGYPLVVMSNGFRTLIDEFLGSRGFGDLEVHAHDCRFDPDGPVIVWSPRGTVCTLCNRPCKRHDLARVRGDARVVYVGDGLSDRCVAQAADVIYARNGLADYLTDIGVEYRPFETFHEITADFSRMADAA